MNIVSVLTVFVLVATVIKIATDNVMIYNVIK